jgi:hypothetical protein
MHSAHAHYATSTPIFLSCCCVIVLNFLFRLMIIVLCYPNFANHFSAIFLMLVTYIFLPLWYYFSPIKFFFFCSIVKKILFLKNRLAPDHR